MALAASQFTNLKKVPISPGLYMVTGTFTGPASYTSGGEDLTNALAMSSLGIRRVNTLSFTNLVDENNAALAVGCEFDHNRTSTSQGKIRFVALGVTAHAHDFLVKGGTAAAGTDALNIKTVIIGKEAATDATSLAADTATKGGVLAAAAVAAGAEVAAATNLSGYICRFVAYGC
jgi:hypothetical protein